MLERKNSLLGLLFLLAGGGNLIAFVSFTMIPSTAATPADSQESIHASSLERAVSGMSRGVEMLQTILDPSTIRYEPTKMKVLFVGLGRTGTTSLTAAMEQLGFTCVHDDTGPAILDLKVDYFQGKLSKDEMFRQFGQRGFNCSFTYEDYEWAGEEHNHDIKVVYSTRNPETWVDSWLSVAESGDILTSRPFIWIPLLRDSKPWMDHVMKDIPTGGHPEGYLDRDTLLKGYSIHEQRVLEAIPNDRLLVYNVKQGWKPLCEFLEVEIPPEDVPFPHINDRLKIAATLYTFRVITWIWPVLLFLPFVLAWKVWQRCKTEQKASSATTKKEQ